MGPIRTKTSFVWKFDACNLYIFDDNLCLFGVSSSDRYWRPFLLDNAFVGRNCLSLGLWSRSTYSRWSSIIFLRSLELHRFRLHLRFLTQLIHVNILWSILSRNRNINVRHNPSFDYQNILLFENYWEFYTDRYYAYQRHLRLKNILVLLSYFTANVCLDIQCNWCWTWSSLTEWLIISSYS